MDRKPTDKVLFHLVPANEAAEEALRHPDNRRFVSLSSSKNKPGLEIGFHVPPFSRGHVIARLGRNTDLILRESYSAVHVAFEIHPETLVVMLSVRTKQASSVTVATLEEEGVDNDPISGDCAIIYGERYRIGIASYVFNLTWRDLGDSDPAAALKGLTMKGYEDSMVRLKDVRSRDRSLLETSTPNSWYMTRLQSSKAPLVREVDLARLLIGQGAFGKVYKTIDAATGNYFAVKVVDLASQGGTVGIELARAALHKEMKIMERVSHDHIIECLGTKDFHTDKPLIFMPLREGSLHSLVANKTASHHLCNQVLDQMLRALDYLDFNKLCHRDVKPLNILYQVLDQDKYRFQLADFGLANDFRLATTFCGTGFYQAPELHTNGPQTPTMDVWSLLVSIMEIHPEYTFPPANVTCYNDVVRAVQAQAADGQLKPMATIDPLRRGTAAQMLVKLFGGQGLTTPRNMIPALELDILEPSGAQLAAQAAPRPAPPPVIEYPRSRHRQRARPAAGPGILPNRIPSKPPAQPVPATRVNHNGVGKRAAPPQPKPQPWLRQAMSGVEQHPVDKRRPPQSHEGGELSTTNRVPGAFPP